MLSNHGCGRAAASLLAVLGLALWLTGCGSGADAGTVAVKGTVTVDGKPVSAASVAFIGKGGARLSSATTDNAGKFSVRAAPGKNEVTVSKVLSVAAPAASDEPMLMPSQGEYQKMAPPPKSEVPEKYGDPKTSGLAFDVVEGMELEIALSSTAK